MNIAELKAELKQGKIRSFYVFTGVETVVMQLYTDKISKLKDTTCTRVDSVVSIYKTIQNKAFIGASNCYIIRGDKEYLTQEDVWQELIEGKIQGKNTIILIYTELDKRSKFFKHHTDIMVQFDRMSAEVLAKHAQKKFGFDAANALLLANICECDLGRVQLEADKAMQLSKIRKCSISDALVIMLKNKLIYVAPGDVIFDFIDAVCCRQVKRSYELYKQLQDLDENALAMISLLYNNFRAIMLVQAAGRCENVSKRTGLTPWQVKLALEKLGHYNDAELINIIKFIRNTEMGIKVGMIDVAKAIDYILIHIF